MISKVATGPQNMLCYLVVIALCFYELIKHVVVFASTPVLTHIHNQRPSVLDRLCKYLPPFNPRFQGPVLQTVMSYILSSWPLSCGTQWTFDCIRHGPRRIGFWRYSPFTADSIETPVVVLVPGLNGCHRCHYVNQLVSACKANGMICAVLDMRKTDFIDSVHKLTVLVDTLAEHHRRIIVFGVSAGGNTVCRYAAQAGTPASVKVCVSAANGIDIATVKSTMAYPWAHVMASRYISHMMALTGIPRRRFRYAQTIWDVDDVVFGYPDVRFYEDRSCHRELRAARIPLVLVNSLDDPFFDKCVLAHAHDAVLANPLVTLVTTDCGGHMGWRDRRCGSWLFDDLLWAIFEVFVA